MPEKQHQPSDGDKEAARSRGDLQYQHQTLVLNNTAGVVLMSALAFVLLAALLRQHKLYRELAVKFALKQ